MKCPTCEKQLSRDTYEDLVVHHCSGCNGYLVDIERFKVIQSRPEEHLAHLEQEIASAASSHDTLKRIRCPKCREKMEKRPTHFGEQKFFIDECHRCSLVWFDAGELAKLRLKFETGERGQEQHRMIARRENMSAEEKKAFEERIDHLPEYKVFKHLFGQPRHQLEPADEPPEGEKGEQPKSNRGERPAE